MVATQRIHASIPLFVVLEVSTHAYTYCLLCFVGAFFIAWQGCVTSIVHQFVK